MSDIRRIVRLYPGWTGITNGSFESGTSGWTETITTPASSTTFASATRTIAGGEGTKALHHVDTLTGTGQYISAASANIPVVPGNTYLAEAVSEIISGSTTYLATLSLVWYQSDGTTTTGTAADSAGASSVGVATHVAKGVAPAAAAYVKVRLKFAGVTGTSGTLDIWWDNVRFREIVMDLNDEIDYHAVRDSFAIQQGARGQSIAASGTRYGGADIVSEANENDRISWQALIAGSTVDEVLSNCEAIHAATENANLDTCLEFRASGASNSTYYPVRGPAEYQLTHSKVRLENGLAEYVDLTFPVAPLAQGDGAVQAIASTTMPAVTQLSTVAGSAPALADVALTSTAHTAAVPFALIGWASRPGTPLASSVAPFGIIEAETGTLTTWAAIGTDTDYRGSNGIRTTASGAGTASATWAVDPSTMEPDAFTRNTIDIEVWARIEIDAAVTSPKLTLSLEPNTAGFGISRYTPEFGSSGKLLVNKPSSGVKFRPVRLGTLTMPVDKLQPLKWKVKLAASWTGGTGVFGIDYLVMVPARQRACTRTGVDKSVYYPNFIGTASDATKMIRSDLSGMIAESAANFGPDAGMGGALIELPAGNVDLLTWLSDEVPDDPTATTNEMAATLASVTGNVYITPRYHLVR